MPLCQMPKSPNLRNNYSMHNSSTVRIIFYLFLGILMLGCTVKIPSPISCGEITMVRCGVMEAGGAVYRTYIHTNTGHTFSLNAGETCYSEEFLGFDTVYISTKHKWRGTLVLSNGIQFIVKKVT